MRLTNVLCKYVRLCMIDTHFLFSSKQTIQCNKKIQDDRNTKAV